MGLTEDGVSHLTGADGVVRCVPVYVFPLHHPMKASWNDYKKLRNEGRGDVILFIRWLVSNDISTDEYVKLTHKKYEAMKICHTVGAERFIYHDNEGS